MSLLVRGMPNWLLAAIMLAGVVMTIYAAQKGKEQNRPHVSRAMLILGAGFAVMAVYSAVRGVPSVPSWIDWSLIIYTSFLYMLLLSSIKQNSNRAENAEAQR